MGIIGEFDAFLYSRVQYQRIPLWESDSEFPTLSEIGYNDYSNSARTFAKSVSVSTAIELCSK